MQYGNCLLMRLHGKQMELFVYDDRVDLYKRSSNKVFSARYSHITGVYFRLASRANTGFIKVRAMGGMFDFVTYKFSRESPEHMNFVLGQLSAAKDEINARTIAARGLPPGSSVVSYF